MPDLMPRHVQPPRDVVIVGGSLAGLMHGIMFKRMGSNVTILEQDASPERRPHSAGIGFGVNLENFLSEYDLTRSQASIPMLCAHLSWRKHVGVWRAPVRRQLTSWGLLYRILRANLDGVPPTTTRAGDGVVTYRSAARVYDLEPSGDDESMIVRFQNVLTEKCDSVEAELVIGADGIHSAVRKLLRPMIRPQYAGYVVWRAMVPENEVSIEVAKFFSDGAATQLLKNSYIVCYVIPTDDGCFEPGKRVINWLWYYNVDEESPEMTEIFTDIKGRHHKNTVPAGLICTAVWERHRDQMLPHMAAPFADLIRTTKSPFVTKVNDVLCTESSFFDDRVILVGDASTTVRPHLAASTDHAAWQCLSLAKVLSGQSTQRRRSRDVAAESERLWLTSRLVGYFGQSSWLSLLQTTFSYILFSIRTRFRLAL
ncbi:FAD binding domain protein [Xylaria palmicola]|nr:FAD binding domain protein [Xylaria palmicola]